MKELYIRMSKNGYQEKPNKDDLKAISWQIKNQNCKKVTYEELAQLLEKGYSVSLAKYKDNCSSLSKTYAEYAECIALDIDSKEKIIKLDDMKKLLFDKFGIVPIIEYRTFSDVDNTRFRLIYRIENKIDSEAFERLYMALVWKIKYLDHATKNMSRIWAGTNKKVIYNQNDNPINFELLYKLINNYDKMIQRKINAEKKAFKKNVNFDTSNDRYIKPEYKKAIMDYIIDNTNLADYIQNKFGGNFKKSGGHSVGCCCLHGGDNKSALVISDKIYTCFTKCGTGNIFTVAKKYYNISNFSELVFRIADEHGIIIPDECIVNRKEV